MNWPRATLEKPLSEIGDIHRSIWQNINDKGIPQNNPCGCFIACDYARYTKHFLARSRTNVCKFCPIKGMGESRNALCMHGLLDRWIKLWRNPKLRKMIAKRIGEVEFVTDEEMQERIKSFRENNTPHNEV